jgi:hypothetical protein
VPRWLGYKPRKGYIINCTFKLKGFIRESSGSLQSFLSLFHLILRNRFKLRFNKKLKELFQVKEEDKKVHSKIILWEKKWIIENNPFFLIGRMVNIE